MSDANEAAFATLVERYKEVCAQHEKSGDIAPPPTPVDATLVLVDITAPMPVARKPRRCSPQWNDESVWFGRGLYTYWHDGRKHYLRSTVESVRAQLDAEARPAEDTHSRIQYEFMDGAEKLLARGALRVAYLRNRIDVCVREKGYLRGQVEGARERMNRMVGSWAHADFHGPDCPSTCPSIKLHQLENHRLRLDYEMEVLQCREMKELYTHEIRTLTDVLVTVDLALKEIESKSKSKKRRVMVFV